MRQLLFRTGRSALRQTKNEAAGKFLKLIPLSDARRGTMGYLHKLWRLRPLSLHYLNPPDHATHLLPLALSTRPTTDEITFLETRSNLPRAGPKLKVKFLTPNLYSACNYPFTARRDISALTTCPANPSSKNFGYPWSTGGRYSVLSNC